MSFEINDDALRQSVDRHAQEEASAQDRSNLLSALLERAINAETDPARQLKLAESSLIAQQKLDVAARRLGLDRQDLLTAEDARLVCSAFVKAIMSLVRENTLTATFCYITDSMQMRLFDFCKEDEQLRKFVYRTDKHWKADCEKYEGEAREALVSKLVRDRELDKRLSNGS